MRPRIKTVSRAIAIGAAVTLTLGGIALAAGAPVPKPAKDYRTPRVPLGTTAVEVSYVTSASSGKVIIAGSAGLGSQFANSEVYLDCPSAPRNAGLKGSPLTDFGFLGATLKLKHGKYGFTKSVTLPHVQLLGSPAPAFTLEVTVTATVRSAKKVTGTVKASGSPCTMKKPVAYTASLSAVPVEKGQ